MWLFATVGNPEAGPSKWWADSLYTMKPRRFSQTGNINAETGYLFRFHIISMTDNFLKYFSRSPWSYVITPHIVIGCTTAPEINLCQSDHRMNFFINILKLIIYKTCIVNVNTTFKLRVRQLVSSQKNLVKFQT